ncbi:NAD(P)-dependent oxidoreductase [Nonomuraea ferruginea]
MRLLVIGATGRTGAHVLEQGVARGHEVTAFTRKPELLKGREGLRAVVTGDATDLPTVREAVAGQDAVISAVGTSGIARTLIAAMRETGVRRVVMTSSRSIPATRPPASPSAWPGCSSDRPTWTWRGPRACWRSPASTGRSSAPPC